MQAWIWGAIIGGGLGIVTTALSYMPTQGKIGSVFLILPFLVSEFLIQLFGGNKFVGGISPPSSGLSPALGTLVNILTFLICVALWALIGAGIGALVGLFLAKSR